MVGLGDLPGGFFYSDAYGVSSDGSVVVGWSSSASGMEAFRWENGIMVGLGGFFSQASDVSANGSVVVGFSESALGDETFRWENGRMVGLGDLPGGIFWSKAYGVSADGSVVVGWGSSVSGQEAFIWDADNGMRSLKDILVNDCGLDLTGWSLTSATGISADGLTIVGWGGGPRGMEGWIATIPESASAFLMFIGTTILTLRRKKR